MLKPAVFHPKARDIIQEFPKEIRLEFGKAIFDLQKGTLLSMPLSRPMNSVVPGAFELREKDESGAYRVFYYTKIKDKILIFHAFTKKTEKTTSKDIATGLIRLKEMLKNES